jgi:hypothetical protein
LLLKCIKETLALLLNRRYSLWDLSTNKEPSVQNHYTIYHRHILLSLLLWPWNAGPNHEGNSTRIECWSINSKQSKKESINVSERRYPVWVSKIYYRIKWSNEKIVGNSSKYKDIATKDKMTALSIAVSISFNSLDIFAVRMRYHLKLNVELISINVI